MRDAQLVLLWAIVLLQGFVLLRQSLKDRELRAHDPITRLPPLQLDTVQGERVTLTDAISTPTLLCVVTAKCPFCRRLVPRLEKLSAVYPGIVVRVLVGGSRADVDQFLGELGVRLPSYRIDAVRIPKDLHVFELPYGLLVDSTGVVLRRGKLDETVAAEWLSGLSPVARQP